MGRSRLKVCCFYIIHRKIMRQSGFRCCVGVGSYQISRQTPIRSKRTSIFRQSVDLALALANIQRRSRRVVRGFTMCRQYHASYRGCTENLDIGQREGWGGVSAVTRGQSPATCIALPPWNTHFDFSQKSSNPDQLFLASRILFLATVSSQSAGHFIISLIDDKHSGRSNVVEIISLRLDSLTSSILGGVKMAREAMTDLLKFTFNLLSYYPKVRLSDNRENHETSLYNL